MNTTAHLPSSTDDLTPMYVGVTGLAALTIFLASTLLGIKG